MTDTITLTIPAGEWLSSNQRLHWAQKARRTRSIRTRAFMLGLAALRAGDVTARTGKTHVHVLVAYPTARKADPPNAYPTVKAIIDGLVDARIFPDDNSDHVSLGFDRDPKKSALGTYRLTLALAPPS